jgi:hypothetical protein
MLVSSDVCVAAYVKRLFGTRSETSSHLTNHLWCWSDMREAVACSGHAVYRVQCHRARPKGDGSEVGFQRILQGGTAY